MSRRRRYVEYPRVVYGPHGASMTIAGPHQWPEGWTATPESGERPPATEPPPIIHMPRSEIKRRLREEGIPFAEGAANVELWRLLHG